jgi:hypothetical protein
MTAFLSRLELESLMTPSEGAHISIFMPTYRVGRETRQNRIRLKNLIRDAEKQLIEMGYRVPDAQALLQPAEDLLGPTDFWRYPGDGLAIFLSADTARRYSLPIRLKKKLVVADRFQVKPLLPLFSGDGSFFVLALSQNEVRLLQGTRSEVAQVELENLTDSLARMLKAEGSEKHLNWYTPSGSPGAPGRNAAIFHGSGSGTENDRAKLLDYFREVDKGLRSILQSEQAPLVLAGVEYLHTLYREASSYPHIFETGISGNPEQLRVDELHAEAWRILQPHFQQIKQTAKKRYRQLAGQNSHLASDDLHKILPAALHGQVELLFVAVGAQQWGEFDPVSLQVHQNEAYRPGNDDLLDRAAVLTLLNGGTVFAVRKDQVPSQSLAAAILRY